MPHHPSSPHPRATLQRLAREGGHTLAALSGVIRRNPAYIQQYIKRGTPERLTETDRATLARFLGVHESLLGGPPERPPGAGVPWLTPQPSAGAGSSESVERPLGELGFPPAFLRGLGARPGRVSAVTVRGDSMERTLRDGDLILVDHDAANRPLGDGIHVLRQDGALLVKRLAREVGSGWGVLSDNDLVPDQRDVPRAALTVVGRVIWFGRALD